MNVVCVLTAPLTGYSLILSPFPEPPYWLRNNYTEIQPLENLKMAFTC